MNLDLTKLTICLCAALLWFSGSACATGIMPPDLGLFGNILVYGGIPILIFIGCLTVWVILMKWLKKQNNNEGISHGQLILDSFRNLVSQIKNLFKRSTLFRYFVLYVVPYLLILAFALYKTHKDNYQLHVFILLQVLVIYAILYLLPLALVKLALKTRKECCDDNEE